jgi:copper chaperone CopZ
MFNKNTKNILIDGMHCEHCAKRVKDELEKCSNVKSVKVDLKKSQAKIVFASKDFDLKEVERTINNLGYDYKGEI